MQLELHAVKIFVENYPNKFLHMLRANMIICQLEECLNVLRLLTEVTSNGDEKY